MRTHATSPPLRVRIARRLTLAVTAVLHAPLAGLSGLALRRLPHLDGLPVLVGSRADPESRSHLQAALGLLAQSAPALRARLRRHVLGIFLTDSPATHGHYSRITGTCILDASRLAQDGTPTTAARLAQAATEAWLWQRGLGRSLEDDRRLLVLGLRARERFLERVAVPSPY